MEQLPDDCLSVIYSFCSMQGCASLATTCSRATEALPGGLTEMALGWQHLVEDEPNLRAIYRNVSWETFLRRLDLDNRLSDVEKHRAWKVMHRWRFRGEIPASRDWLDHVVNDIISFRGHYVPCPLRETIHEFHRVTFALGGVGYEIKNDILRCEGGFIYGALTPVGWHVTKRWTPELTGHMRGLVTNPTRLLADMAECPFCGKRWDAGGLNAECALKIARWRSWADRGLSSG